MKEIVPLLLLSLFAGVSTLPASPVDRAVVALMRLSEQPNYAWHTSISDDARSYEIDGRTCASGYSAVTMPVINSVRRRLGRENADTRVELVFRGNADCVLLTEKGWMRPDELPDPDFDPSHGHNWRPGSSVISANIPGAVRVRHGKSIIAPAPPPPVRRDLSRGYSNLQLAVSPPHEELAVIVSSHRDFQVEDGVVSGRLTELGAKLLLVRDGQKEIVPLAADGTFRVWLRDGHVARYQLELEGTLEVTAPPAVPVAIRVQQRSLTVVGDFGSSAPDIPADVRAKLASR